MRQLKDICESVFDVDDNIENVEQVIIESIKEFIDSHYANTNVGKLDYTISKKPNKNNKYEVELWGSYYLKDSSTTSLTNDKFIFTTCYGTFDCGDSDIESLEGCPQYVDNFICSGCNSLKSLKGGPQRMKGSYSCDNCNSIQDLEGCPKEVFNLICADCAILDSFKGAPKIIKGNVRANGCGGNFIANDITKVSKVHGNITVK